MGIYMPVKEHHTSRFSLTRILGTDLVKEAVFLAKLLRYQNVDICQKWHPYRNSNYKV